MTFIPYGRQNILEEDIEAVISVLKSDYLTQGPAVKNFEDKFANYIQANHVVAVSNGTTGLHLAYLAAGIGPGDAVIVPAITFAATSNTVLSCGATPIFCDVTPSGHMSAVSAKNAVKLAQSKGLKVKALAPVHYAGQPCDMGPLVSLAKDHNLLIIEDACHAVGAEYRLKEDLPFVKVGSCQFTHMTVFSFHPVKHLTTGEGGAVSTSDERLALKLQELRTHGITKDPSRFVNKARAFDHSGAVNPWYMEMQSLGQNYRLCDIQAALGTAQLSRIQSSIERRRQIAAMYEKRLGEISSITLPSGDSETNKHSYHLYPVQIDFKKLNISRGSFIKNLQSGGVGTQVHYIPVSWHPYYENNSKAWDSTPLLKAVEFYERELSLPMYVGLTDEQIDQVCRSLVDCLK